MRHGATLVGRSARLAIDGSESLAAGRTRVDRRRRGYTLSSRRRSEAEPLAVEALASRRPGVRGGSPEPGRVAVAMKPAASTARLPPCCEPGARRSA